MFRTVEVLMSMPVGATSTLKQKLRYRCQWRLHPSVLRRAASEERRARAGLRKCNDDCGLYRETIQLGLSQGRNAMGLR